MKLRHPFLIAAVVALAVLGAATAGIVTTPSSATKTTIKVTEKEFHITLSSHKATAGQVRFEIKNTGKYPHGFAISGAGVKLKKIAAIEPGKSAVLLVNVRSGRYSIWCPMPGHKAKGMLATLTLPGATAAPATTATTDTSGDTTTTSMPIPGY